MLAALTLPNLSRATWWLLALACVLHAWLGAAFGLSVDEAHYALYAAHPDWSYFDHPPLVGWVQWPLVALDAPTGVLRLLPQLLWLVTALLVHQLAERLCDGGAGSPSGRAGFWAVAAVALAPLLHVLGIGLLPDTLLMTWTAALMASTLHLMNPEAVRRPLGWLVLGGVLGLAGLSKYTAILAALAVGACLLRAHGLALLRRPWPWLAVLLAMALVLPVVYWNQANHWVSFAYQAQHGAGGQWQAGHVLRFLVVQLFAYGALLLWAWPGVRRVAPGPRRWLVLFALIPLAVLAVLAGGGTSLPHWTAPAWVALAPFAGVALARAEGAGRRRWVAAWAVSQAAICVLLLGLMVSAGVPVLVPADSQAQGARAPNPFADLHGWDAAGDTARSLAARHGLRSVSVQNWTLASRLGWYARPLPVHVLEDRFDQFDLWAGDLPQGGDTLLVDWSLMPYAVPLGAHGFAQCTLLAQQEVHRLGRVVASFRFHACQGWSGSPKPRLLDAP